jgi:signal transduction histidine kinase
LNKSDAISFLELLYQVQVACNQLETIKISSDKAVKVVQEVRAFIKGDANLEKKSVNLRQNIATVLNIFNYDLQKNVDLKFNVDDSFSFQGYDIKLFQLWSNLVKNAIEAMENQEYRYLGIFAEKKNGKLAVTFENNGPKISDEVRNNMFKKFYTTKSKKSGSGLGLSIVKNILRDHKAQINVESSDEITKFIITFEAWMM